MTTSIRIKVNDKPNLHSPTFLCDKKIHEKLDAYDATSLINKSNFSLFLGKPGSGKTSLMVSMLNTPCLFKRCFHNIFVFMPAHSRGSLKNNIFEQLPPDQLYDHLNIETIDEVFDKIEENAEEKKLSLIILDDVQQYLKDKHVAKRLLEIAANRRHLRTSIWIMAQTYRSIPRQVRQVITNLFVFKISKSEMENIFSEQVELFKEHFQNVLKKAYKEPHDYLFIDTGSQRLFKGFDEILMDEEDSDDEDDDDEK